MKPIEYSCDLHQGKRSIRLVYGVDDCGRWTYAVFELPSGSVLIPEQQAFDEPDAKGMAEAAAFQYFRADLTFRWHPSKYRPIADGTTK